MSFQSFFEKTKIWKPEEPAHHSIGDALSLDKLSQKQGTTTGLSAKMCVKVTASKLKRLFKTLSTFALAPEAPWNPSEHHHDFESAIPSLMTAAMPPDPVDVSTTPTPAPNKSHASKDAQVNLQDTGKDVTDSGEMFSDALDDFQNNPDASKTKSKVWISMDNSKTPMDTPNMHGIPKEAQVNLLDQGEESLDAGEHFHGTLVDLQDEELLDHHQEFGSIMFVESMCIGISNLSMSPKLATSMIWKPKDKEPPSIIPEL